MIRFCSDENFCPFLLCPTGAPAEAYRLSNVPCLIGTLHEGTIYNSINASCVPGKMLESQKDFLG